MRRIPVAIAIVLLTAACGPAGSGELARDSRSVPAFDRISVVEGLDLSVELRPGALQEVAVVYDDNLVDLIGTEVVDGELRIEIIDTFRVTGGGRFVDVVVGDLELIHAESGADVRVTGSIDEISIRAEDGAAMDLSLLEALRVIVDASGGAYVAVHASESVTGSASGGAEILVLGDPATVDVDVRGGATVGSE